MAATVRIPSALRAEAGGRSSLELSADSGMTLGEVLDQIAASWPLLERRIRDERGELRRYVNLYVDGEECRRLGGLGTPVTDRAEILIIPSVAGG
jgi:molybdopterin synthase sulfur carrier subunit